MTFAASQPSRNHTARAWGQLRRNVKIRNVFVFSAARDHLINNNFGATTSVTNLLAYVNDVERVPIRR